MTSSTLTSSQCYFCEQKAVTKCEKCQLVAFCSDFTHKEIHYDKQTNTCLAFKVRKHRISIEKDAMLVWSSWSDLRCSLPNDRR